MLSFSSLAEAGLMKNVSARTRMQRSPMIILFDSFDLQYSTRLTKCTEFHKKLSFVFGFRSKTVNRSVHQLSHFAIFVNTL